MAQFGVEARVAVLEAEMAILKASQMAISNDVRMIRDAVIGAKGGWKTLLLIGGAGATAGAFFMKLLSLGFKLP